VDRRMNNKQPTTDMVEYLSTGKLVHAPKNGLLIFIERLDRGGVCHNDG